MLDYVLLGSISWPQTIASDTGPCASISLASWLYRGHCIHLCFAVLLVFVVDSGLKQLGGSVPEQRRPAPLPR